MKRMVLSLLMTMAVSCAYAQGDKVNKIIVGFPQGRQPTKWPGCLRSSCRRN